MKDFFISYNKADKDWAEWIAWELEEAGYSTIVQAWDFRPGSNFVLEMDRAAAETTRTLVVISPDYLSARLTQPEWAAAFAQTPTGAERTLVPVVVRESDTRGLLNQIVHINLVGLKEADAREKLLSGLITRRAKSNTSPSFSGPPKRPGMSPPSFPGGSHLIWTVPHPRNPNFIGREELLEELRVKLTSGQPAALTQAIHGLGGVGKTQIAIEYAYRYAGYYNAVLWVRAEEPTTLAADFASLSEELGIIEQDTRDQDAAIKSVLRWLRENSKWLLIFDNAPEGRQIANYLPSGANGHVLITSRNRHWRQYAQPLVVEVMEPYEAINLLLKRPNETDKATASKLAEELGYLPIALAQARAYMEQKQSSLSEYLSLLQKFRNGLLIPSDDYPVTIAATWELSIQAVREHSPEAADLLNLCAFFAPENIPLEMIIAGAKHLPESLKNVVLEPLTRNNIVGNLDNYSLAEVDRVRNTVSVHRLVQAVMRDRLSSEERQMWTEAALQVVDTGFSYRISDVGTWSVAAIVLPHALAVIGSSDLQEVNPTEVGKLLLHLLNRVGLYLQHKAQYTDARDQLTRALAVAEVVYGPNHSDVAAILNNLGSVLRVLGDLQGARAYFERALAISEAVYGPRYSTTATMLNNLGLVLQNLGDLQGARAYFERALAISEAMYGPDHPTVATMLNNVGTVLKELGDLQTARAYFERALAISEAMYGPDHPTLAIRLNNLGGLLQELGDLQTARAYFERALAISEAVYGPDHPDVATMLNNLGLVLQNLGDLQGARAYFERALAISEAVYGPDHPTVAIGLNNLGTVLSHLGELQEALVSIERALRIYQNALGLHHPSVATVLNNSGAIFLRMERFEDAEACFERALDIDQVVYAPNHPKIATDLNNLGNVLKSQGDLVGARSNLERALSIDRAAYGSSHPTVAIRLYNLGMIEKELGNTGRAQLLLEEARNAVPNNLSPERLFSQTIENDLKIGVEG